MGESYHVDLGQAMELSEVDGALLMELMEDLPPSDLLDGDVDQLSHVIRSLEAEISGGGDMAVRMVDGESVAGASSEDGGMLEDMLLDLDDYEGVSFGYWPELSLMGHEVEGWYVYSNGYEGGVVGYEAIDHQYHCSVEGSVEQVYSPLWE
ncbi:hypothetical protein BAE44_0006779 [Dichanthelium oligosanthes]|uniref:Uncharacterized protein n=1 Tax=Dichanthelium oligosanthes TaxID=888268 RepID=A0A1E5W477_9POAL|nr:hypothetical protein BAE44_0006779 [Dichanthelium oligosanthes]